MSFRPQLVLLVTLVVTGLVIRALAGSAKAPAANFILRTAYAPFHAVRSWAQDQATLRSENVRLRQLLAELSWKAQQGEEYAREALRLRSLLDLPLGHEPTLQVGRVVGWDRRGGHEEVIVDRGKTAGIEQYAPALTEDGVAGRVSLVTADFARVQLLIDPGCRVAVRDARSGVLGVVRMSGENLVMDRVAIESDVAEGDTLVTAGIGGIFPAGLLVGTVTGAHKPGASLLALVEVQPTARFNRLDYLFFLSSQAELFPDATLGPEGDGNP